MSWINYLKTYFKKEQTEPGQGPGPLLPVRALFEVTGQIYMSAGNFPVRGLFVHEI